MLKRFDSVTNQPELTNLSRAANDVASFEAMVKKEYEAAHAQAQLALEMQVSEENSNKAIQQLTQRRLASEKRAQELREMIQYKRLAKSSMTAEGYRAFLTRVGKLHSELALRKSIFAQAASYSPHDLKHAAIDKAYEYAKSWVHASDSFTRELAELEAQGRSLAEHGGDACGVATLRDLLADVQSLYTQCVSEVSREHARRESHADSVADFLRSQGQLVHWCRAQKTALESVSDPEYIQELCTSFQNNVSVMETNLLVLVELSEPLAPNPTISKALMEVNEVWMSLAVYAFERMRDSLLEQHARSGLENATKRWLNELNEPLKKFLEDAKALLQMPTDEVSKAVTQPAWQQCVELLEYFGPHAIMMEHLSDYSIREEMLKEHYAAIRRAVFAKLTLLSLSFHGQVRYPRRQEYTDRLAELTDWVQCKSQSGAWRQLLSRVEKMRQLIEDNEALHGTAEDRSS